MAERPQENTDPGPAGSTPSTFRLPPGATFGPDHSIELRPMPTPAQVQQFMTGWAMDYDIRDLHLLLTLVPPITPHPVDISAFGDATDDQSWFRLADAPGAPPIEAPSSRWTRPMSDKESALITVSSKVIGGFIVGSVSNLLVKYGLFSASHLGDRPRDTLTRLFDRLRLRHALFLALPPVLPLRYGTWMDRHGEVVPAQTTTIAMRHSANPWEILRTALAGDDGGSSLGMLLRLNQPDALTLPLAWDEAVVSGVPGPDGAEVSLTVNPRGVDPSELVTSIREMARLIDRLIEEDLPPEFWVKFLGKIVEPSADFDVVYDLADSLEHVPDRLRAAVRAGVFGNHTAMHLIAALRDIDYTTSFIDANNVRKALFGLTSSELDAVSRGLYLADAGVDPGDLTQPDLPLGPSDQPYEPLILLGDSVAAYARNFPAGAIAADTPVRTNAMLIEGLQYPSGPPELLPMTLFAEGRTPPERAPREEQPLADAWGAWWNQSQPTIRAAYVMDTASQILEQLFYVDDALLAMSGLAAGDGFIGQMIRRMLDTSDLSNLTEFLGGAPPASAVRFAFRQLMTDMFLSVFINPPDAEVELPRYAPQSLYPVFCWMDSADRRARIDAALGPVVLAPPSTGLLRIIEEHFAGWGHYNKVPPPSSAPLPTRGFVVELATPGGGVASGAIEPSESGALGRLLRDLAEGVEPKDLDRCDLAILRDWMTDAAGASLATLREDLEPTWGHVLIESGRPHSNPMPSDWASPVHGPRRA